MKVLGIVAALILSLVGFSTPAATAGVLVVAVGDIACGPAAPTVTPLTCQQDATAALALSLKPKAVFPLGDLVYAAGTYPNFMAGYEPSWGQLKLKTISRPIPGNHERGSPGLAGYYQYWGAKATPQEPKCVAACLGYYSFDVGTWHVLALNTSSCSESSLTCADFTAQAAWVTADVAAHPAMCTLALLHNPLWSYGSSATASVAPLFAALIAGGVDVALAGHDHNYQRFKPQLLDGTASPAGMAEYVVGTGGVNQMPVGVKVVVPNRAAAFQDFGVLDLHLAAGRWTSSFRSISGAIRDKSSGVCHA